MKLSEVYKQVTLCILAILSFSTTTHANICSTVRGEESAYIKVDARPSGDFTLNFITEKGVSYAVGEHPKYNVSDLDGLMKKQNQNTLATGLQSAFGLAFAGLLGGGAASIGYSYLSGWALLSKVVPAAALIMIPVAAAIYFSDSSPIDHYKNYQALKLLKSSIQPKVEGKVNNEKRCTEYTDMGIRNYLVFLTKTLSDLKKSSVNDDDSKTIDPSILTSTQEPKFRRSGEFSRDIK